MSLLKQLKDRFSKPLFGLGLVGVSTTLAACYGPPPQTEVATREYCEAFLIQSCTDENLEMPAECKDLRERIYMPKYCENHAPQASAQVTEPQNAEPQNAEPVIEG